MLLDRNGALTVGDTILDLYRRMEKIEHSAESLLAAHLLGEVRTLENAKMEGLLKARAEYGVGGKFFKRRT